MRELFTLWTAAPHKGCTRILQKLTGWTYKASKPVSDLSISSTTYDTWFSSALANLLILQLVSEINLTYKPFYQKHFEERVEADVKKIKVSYQAYMVKIRNRPASIYKTETSLLNLGNQDCIMTLESGYETGYHKVHTHKS